MERLGPVLNESRHMISPRVLNWSPWHLIFASSILCVLVSVSIIHVVIGFSLLSLMDMMFLATLFPNVEHFSKSL